MPTNKKDSYGNPGNRTDSKDLIQDWKDDKINRNLTGKYVENKEQLLGVDTATTDYILGTYIMQNIDICRLQRKIYLPADFAKLDNFTPNTY